jgi:hypothetical protein
MSVRTYGKRGKRFALKKDLVIKAGTVFDGAPVRVEYNYDHYEAIIGLTPDCAGHLVFGLEQLSGGELYPDTQEWFEEVE